MLYSRLAIPRSAFETYYRPAPAPSNFTARGAERRVSRANERDNKQREALKHVGAPNPRIQSHGTHTRRASRARSWIHQLIADAGVIPSLSVARGAAVLGLLHQMDNEQQKDEIIALESICNEEEFSYQDIDGKHECTLNIFIRLPEDYHLIYRDTRIDEQPITKVPISHLPPLTLYVSMPPDYPSKSPPKFTLCSSWLWHSMLSKLCQKLDQLWEENKEQEILFTWMAFLQNETLEFLLIQEHLDISYAYTMHIAALEKVQKSLAKAEPGKETDAKPEGNADAATDHKRSHAERKLMQRKRCRKQRNKKPIDQRAVVDRPNSKNPVQMLVDYDEARKRIEFKRSFYTCKVCFTEKSGEQSTEFTPCRHVFCKECITSYLEVKIKDGTVQSIGCPEDKCSSEATPGQIKDLLSPELFTKYDSILLSVTLETMTDIVYCPRRHCQYPVSREPNEHMANCPACQYAFCIYCKMVYHGIEPCKVNSVEKQKLVKEYQEASDETKIQMEQRYGKKQLQVLVENTMSEDWISSNSHHCPHCNAAIEKSDGCNKMTCGRCNTYFCWICGTRLDPQLPYLHYRNPKSKCYNKLYHGLIADEDDEEDDDIDFPAVYLDLDSEEEDFYDNDFFIDLDI